MRIHPVLKALVLGVSIGLFAVSQVRADELYGRIRGTVSDPSGAMVVGAQVAATNIETGISKQILSGAEGNYEFLQLAAPATYRVSARQSGFKLSEAQNIHLDLNQIYVLNIQLELGQASQQVTVKATAAQISTTSMQLGTTVTGNTIEDMPLNGRNWLQLQQLQPGVAGASDRLGGVGIMGPNFATNGAQTQQNAFYVNGVDAALIGLNVATVIPSPDAIAEFRMVTSTIDPEYGRNSGAIMNAVIKSGSNQLHGDGFEFYRDTSMDSRNFFQATTSPFHQNQFGGTAGGPILLPHIYDGKDKTFFFFSYQGTRNVVPQAFSVPTVFTSAQRNGAFADLVTSNGSSAFPLVGDSGATFPAGTPYSTIFSGGTIPSADFNPLALKLMNQFVPPPNLNGNEYTFNPSITGGEDQYITRIDQNFSDKDSIWGYWFWERHPFTQTLPAGGATLPGFASYDDFHGHQYALAWNHAFSGTTLNEARFGYFRFNLGSLYAANPINPTSYGFTGINPQQPNLASLPAIALTGLFTLGFSPWGPQPGLENTYQFIDNFSKIVGRHTLKAGFTMERFQASTTVYYSLSGTFNFGGTGAFSTGDPGADFLLGLPDSYNQQSGSIMDVRAREYYSYFQDEFKLRRNFTLTLGMGWDIETHYLNLYNGGRGVNAFRPGQQSTVYPTAPLGVLWPGDKGINSAGGVNTPYTDFAPRLGFAWSPGSSSKWSLHAGVGIYYNRTESEMAFQNSSVIPFTLNSFGVAGGSPSLAAPFSGWCPAAVGTPTACSSPNPFPYAPPPPGSAINFAALEPLTINTVSPNFGAPMSENYNLMIERQLTGSMILSVAYIGSAGHHLVGNYELNPAGQAPGVNPVAAALGCTPSNLGTCAPQTFRYNPLTTGIAAINQQSAEFNSNYNSLQVSLSKRLSQGLSFLAAYTWSRFFDENSMAENQDAFNPPGINPFNLRGMYGPSDNDAPQRLVFSYDYTLPFYRFAHRFRRLTDDWKLVGITTFQSGFPVRVANTAAPSDTCWGAAEVIDVPCWDRPNRTSAALNIGNPRTNTINGTSNYYFNPAAFTPAGPGTGTGTSSRNPFHGPGLNNFDISLLKDIHITESRYIELRLETYNTFNHTQFTPFSVLPNFGIGGVVADINDPRFGRVIAASAGRVVQLGGKIYF